MADDGTNCQEKYQGNTSALNHSSPGSVLSKAFFISGVTLASIVGGFGFAIGQARRRGPEPFDVRTQEGVKLAIKALGYGTVLAISGVGLLILGVKTALGVKDAKEFGEKMKSILPAKDGKLVSHFDSWRIPRNKEGRNNEKWLPSSSDR